MQRPVIAQSAQSQSSPPCGSHAPSGAPLQVPLKPVEAETVALAVELTACVLVALELVAPPEPVPESPQLTATIKPDVRTTAPETSW
jgi:hypothetical protein